MFEELADLRGFFGHVGKYSGSALASGSGTEKVRRAVERKADI